MRRLSRSDLYRATWSALVRLARYHGFSVAEGPETTQRRIRLVEALIRRMDEDNIKEYNESR